MVLVFFIVIFSYLAGISQGQLRVGFYESTCPNVEPVVSAVVREVAASNQNIAPVLLRLHFHDCFVQGCDGSILIDNGENAERHAFGHQGVGGFEVIERAKAQVEAMCPGVVSCADIVALAARDAVVLANGPSYEVETGRRDGVISNLSLAENMPDVSDSIQILKAKFSDKGLSEKDLVVLTAHTIGTTACFFMTKRLYNFFPGGGSDPSINPSLLPELMATCPQNGNVNVRLPIDEGSSDAFDNQILQNIRSGFAVLRSDASLYEDVVTRSVVDSYFGMFSPFLGISFEADFANAMVKMGRIDVLTGFQGTIRRVCSAF
ncbi:peroxidase 43-like isoform X2 [Nicotiana sylvestris]|uniref:Peroxidase n=2 Tax=Nicotiana TaxID=4085 RepID=A0A1S3XS66_TOBAC|nr:PREDICTED: peroxidase 43-like isoform X2 [Nicotiana sylvestris]XP_016442788.1 PREDICTED: peroxidase 43-like isoform X2 [Nicotiana tabacum]